METSYVSYHSVLSHWDGKCGCYDIQAMLSHSLHTTGVGIDISEITE